MNLLPIPLLDALQDEEGWNTSTHYRFLTSVEKNLRTNISDTDTLKTDVATLQTQKLTSSVAKAYNWNGSTTNTYIEFTGIPTWVQRVTVMFNSLSTSGTSPLIIQVGSSSGGYESSNYFGVSMLNATGAVCQAMSDGFLLTTSTVYTATGYTYFGQAILSLLNVFTNTWAFSGNLSAPSVPYNYTTSGSKSLGSILDRLRITTSGGTEFFDSGIINIMYE